MTRPMTSLDPDYFERMFQDTADPWDLETSDYEQRKFAATIAALRGRTYDRGLEIGCAKGVLTQRLAAACHSLLALDISKTAVAAARKRLAGKHHVTFGQMAFPRDTPATTGYDLVVLSEVVYYWDDTDIVRAADWVAQHTAPGAEILLVHWTGDTDYPQSGDDAVRKLGDALGDAAGVVVEQRTEHYRLDLWRMQA